jgi:exodeoxyribonuclease-5
MSLLVKEKIILDTSQNLAISKICEWYTKYTSGRTTWNEFRLGGLAGCGKSTIVSYVIESLDAAYKSLIIEKAAPRTAIIKNLLSDPNISEIDKFTLTYELNNVNMKRLNVRFIAYSGKAALVLRRKGMNATTIHSLIYKVTTAKDAKGVLRPIFKLRPIEELSSLDLIVVDEASMVNKEIYEDLKSFGIPVLFVGDHGQLPPIQGNFNLMDNADIYLEEQHRNAGWIVKLAMMAREGKSIPNKKYSDNVVKVPFDKIQMKHFSNADQVICGTNRTRTDMTRHFRNEFLEKDSLLPEVGEKIICRKNDNDLGLVNGLVGTCLKAANPIKTKGSFSLDFMADDDQSYYGLTSNLAMFDESIIGKVHEAKLYGYHKFEFAYLITCHLSQGSEYDKLLVLDEPFGDAEMQRRWRYTAYTRAQNVLVIAA